MELVLIHGMGRTPLSMLRLRRRLRRAGHHPVLFGYAPAFETLQGATDRLTRLIERRPPARPYALVGHSLGTVLIRTTLLQLEGRAPVACFLLAPPIRACKAAKFFSRFWLYRLLTGEMGQLLANDAFMRQLPLPSGVVRIYAGTAGPRASWLPFGMAENDGVLEVSEAMGGHEAVALRVPALHTFIMNSPQVWKDIVSALSTIQPSGRSPGAPSLAR